MSTFRSVPAVTLSAALIGSATIAIADPPSLGQLATPDQIAAWDTDIAPDGTGLPPGKGTAAEGDLVYHSMCAACHGERGEGNPNDRLVGGHGTLSGGQVAVKTVGSYWPYATTLFDYTRRAMPWNAPKSLTDDQVYSVTAYILSLNGIIGANEEINTQTLPKVQMPNRDGFISIYPKEP
jgi:S-disulfanyl-L-cysteine oxidoreductase SoxD